MSPWGRLVLAVLVQVFVVLAAFSPPVIAPVAFDELHLGSEAWLGIYTAILYLASMYATLASGGLIRHLGAVRVSQFGLLATALGIALITTGIIWLIIAAPILIGLGYGLMTPAGSQILVTGDMPKGMGLVMSIKQSSVPIGGMIAGFLLPPLTAWLDWRGSLLVILVPCLGAALLVQIWRPALDAWRDTQPPAKGHKSINPLASLQHIRNPRVLKLAVCSSFFSAMQLSVITFLVSYLTSVHALSLVAAGTLLSIALVGGIVGRIGWGWLNDIAIRTRVILLGLGSITGVATAVLGLLQNESSWIAVAVTVFILGATAIGWNGVFLAEIARIVPPREVGAVTGSALFFTYIGVIIGLPFFSGILYISGSYILSFQIIAMGTFLAGLFFFLGGKPEDDIRAGTGGES